MIVQVQDARCRSTLAACRQHLSGEDGCTMAATLGTNGRESSNTFARRRDTLILWLLKSHPATAGMLVEIGLFRSRARASKRLHRLIVKKRLRVAGTVALKD